ncbi:MAG: hypothetical protein H7312_14165 [Tardiphaga sp.]|nr:hypothetical protein [Tardiphaga sp.]
MDIALRTIAGGIAARVKRISPAAGAILGVSILACAVMHQRISINSIDIAGHYTLVDYYSTWWGPYADLHRIHWTMSQYPPLSHLFGAAIGWATGNPFVGMHFASLIFLSAIYVVLLKGADHRNPLASLLTWITAATAIFLISSYRVTFGKEIQGNYFYAQIAGSAVSILILFVLSKRVRSTLELVAVPAAVYVAGWLFPLAQLQLSIGMASLWLLSAVRTWLTSRGLPIRELAVGAAMLVLCAMAVRYHPIYGLMRSIADNNAVIDTGASIRFLVASAILLLALSSWYGLLAARGRSPLTAPYFLPAAGLAASIACITHYVAGLMTQSGSDYALLKHVFSVVTLFIVLLSCACGKFLARLNATSLRRLKSIPPLLALTTISCVVVLITVYPSSQNAGHFIAQQKEARELARTSPELHGATSSQLRALSPLQNFILTAVDLRMRDDIAHALTLEKKPPSQLPVFLLESIGSTPGHCAAFTGPTMMVVRASCAERALPR